MLRLMIQCRLAFFVIFVSFMVDKKNHEKHERHEKSTGEDVVRRDGRLNSLRNQLGFVIRRMTMLVRVQRPRDSQYIAELMGQVNSGGSDMHR